MDNETKQLPLSDTKTAGIIWIKRYRLVTKHYIPSILIEETVRRKIETDDRIKRIVFFVDLICRPADSKALIGDLFEVYEAKLEMYGERRAKIWLRAQVFWTVMSCLKSRLRGIGMAAIGAAFTWIGGKIGF